MPSPTPFVWEPCPELLLDRCQKVILKSNTLQPFLLLLISRDDALCSVMDLWVVLLECVARLKVESEILKARCRILKARCEIHSRWRIIVRTAAFASVLRGSLLFTLGLSLVI